MNTAPESLAFATLYRAVDRALHEAPNANPGLVLSRLLTAILDHAANEHDIPAPAQFAALYMATTVVIQDRSTTPVAAFVTGSHFAATITDALALALPAADLDIAQNAVAQFKRDFDVACPDAAAAPAANIHHLPRRPSPTDRGPTPGDAA